MSTHGESDRHFADDIFKSIFDNEKNRILIRISLKAPIDNESALVQEMAWRRAVATPLLEAMLI